MSRIRSIVGRTFHSLRTRNYRLYFFGQIVSLSGTWMQSVAQAWLVLKLTGSGVALGVVTALQFVPILVAGPWGGVIADRVDRRRLIIWTQAASAALALALGVLTVAGAVELWTVYLLAGMLGLVTVVDMPARQAFVMEMVGPEEVVNAVSLNGVMVNASRIVGPAVAGILIATVGIGICFLLNAASFLAVIVGLIMMDAGALRREAPTGRRKGQLRAGLRYVWATSGLRWPLLLMAAVGMLAFNFSVLFPLLARFTFGGGAQVYGLLFSLMGLGAVAGGLVVAGRNRATSGLLAGAAMAMGVSLFLGAFAPTLAFEMVAVVPIGAASTVFIATANAILQVRARPDMRGRVMSLFSMVFLGTAPIGGLLAGWVAEQWGPRAGMALGGGAALVAGAVAMTALRSVARRERGGLEEWQPALARLAGSSRRGDEDRLGAGPVASALRLDRHRQEVDIGSDRRRREDRAVTGHEGAARHHCRASGRPEP